MSGYTINKWSNTQSNKWSHMHVRTRGCYVSTLRSYLHTYIYETRVRHWLVMGSPSIQVWRDSSVPHQLFSRKGFPMHFIQYTYWYIDLHIRTWTGSAVCVTCSCAVGHNGDIKSFNIVTCEINHCADGLQYVHNEQNVPWEYAVLCCLSVCYYLAWGAF